jgi:hypothetical protein
MGKQKASVSEVTGVQMKPRQLVESFLKQRHVEYKMNISGVWQ